MEPLTPPPGAFSRRSFLRLAGGGAVAVGAGGLLTSTSLAAELAVGGDFDLFTWAGYDGAQTLKAWYADKGIKLKLKAITNEDIAAVIKGPGGSKWDALSVNQGDSQYYAALGVASPITVKEVPALGQMYPFFRSSAFWQIKPGTYNSRALDVGPAGGHVPARQGQAGATSRAGTTHQAGVQGPPGDVRQRPQHGLDRGGGRRRRPGQAHQEAARRAGQGLPGRRCGRTSRCSPPRSATRSTPWSAATSTRSSSASRGSTTRAPSRARSWRSWCRPRRAASASSTPSSSRRRRSTARTPSPTPTRS